jgi:uncharacterized protein YjbI with pentapeptide repeats
MKPATSIIKTQIASYIKNKLDISDLIVDLDIRGLDLSHAIIKKFNRMNSDISGVNLSYSMLGSDNNIFSVIKTKMNNCNFEGANFVGKAWIRSCDAKGCNFKNVNAANLDYAHSDFTNGSFCGAIIRIGTKESIGSTFDSSLLKDLTSSWANKLTIEEQK